MIFIITACKSNKAIVETNKFGETNIIGVSSELDNNCTINIEIIPSWTSGVRSDNIMLSIRYEKVIPLKSVEIKIDKQYIRLKDVLDIHGCFGSSQEIPKILSIEYSLSLEDYKKIVNCKEFKYRLYLYDNKKIDCFHLNEDSDFQKNNLSFIYLVENTINPLRNL